MAGISKIKKRYIIIPIIIVVLLIVLSFVSFVKFRTANPFSAGFGLSQVLFTGKEYAQIQSAPEVYIAKPDNAQNNLIKMMQENGYTYSSDKRLGSNMVFENGKSERVVTFTVNGYYSLWVFNK